MRQWIAWAARLYPAKWRARYADEFEALLEDHNAGWREFSDVLREALKMQMTSAAAYWKLAGGIAVAGALIATAISFGMPRMYSSTAVIRVSPLGPQGPMSEDTRRQQAELQVNEMEQAVLSRTTLEGIITRPDLDLYKEERSREPLEDIVMRMRSRDIQIRMVTEPAPSGAYQAFTVSFSYSDQRKAQAVTRDLATQFFEQNLEFNRSQRHMWGEIWPNGPLPPTTQVEVLDPASFPRKSISPSRAQFAAVGLGVGLALGLLTVVAIRLPKRTLQVAGFAVGFCVLAVGVSLLVPDTYTSSVVMRLTAPEVPASLTHASPAPPLADKLQRLEQGVFSRAIPESIITDPALDLYKSQRAHKPLEEIVSAMRRDIRVRPVKPSQTAFEISFSYPDPEKAQAVARKFVARFIDENATDERNRAQASGDAKLVEIAEHKLAAGLAIVDFPNLPEGPAFPNRPAISLVGFAFGLLLGPVVVFTRRETAADPS